jgi:hypothetical protein
VAVKVEELLSVLVPETLAPCQYQVTPPGGVPRVSTLLPQLFSTEGAEGMPGIVLTETDIDLLLPQHPVVLFLPRK